MTNYIGVRCPVCNKKFEGLDDIVVCPICGAPHHRDCYAQKGECAFAKDHISGSVWRAPPEMERRVDEGGVKLCPRCGTGLSDGTGFCQICGQDVSKPPKNGDSGAHGAAFTGSGWGWGLPGMEYVNNPLYTVYGGVNPDEHIEEETVRDMAAYIGPSSAYYVPRFKEMSERGRTISPNFAALFFNFFYYFYRKMYVMGAILFALYIISSIPGYMYAKEVLPIAVRQFGFTQMFEQAGIEIPSVDSVNADAVLHYQNLSYMTRLINFAIGVIISLCCNRFYYEKCVKTVKKIRLSVGIDEKDPSKSYRSALIHLGGTSKFAPALAGVAYVVVYFVLVGIIYTY